MTDNTPRATGGDIHRLLDTAFTGIEMTPDAQDLKEEVRANLVARVDELQSQGVSPADAARSAIAELGDVRDLLDEPASAASQREPRSFEAEMLRNRVRPKPAFVVGIVVAAIAVVAGLTLGILGAAGVLPLPIGPVIALFGIAASGTAWLVGDSVAQETTMNHPMPQKRAAGFFLATFLAVYGLAFGLMVAVGALPVWAITFAAVGIAASIILYAFLGATQTNRKKAWVRNAQPQMPANRFEQEPETAARFGIYTAVIWLVTLAICPVLYFTVGWVWIPLALFAALAVMMLTLARMMFGPRKH